MDIFTFHGQYIGVNPLFIGHTAKVRTFKGSEVCHADFDAFEGLTGKWTMFEPKDWHPVGQPLPTKETVVVPEKEPKVVVEKPVVRYEYRGHAKTIQEWADHWGCSTSHVSSLLKQHPTPALAFAKLVLKRGGSGL